MTDKILLVGLTGSGKSTVGAALATRLGWPYLDNDLLLERTTGLSTPDLLAAQGADALTRVESKVLTLQLGMPAPLVAGLADGIVLDPTNRDRIAGSGSHVVWLRAAVPLLARRVANGGDRTRLGDDPAVALRALAAERNLLYELVSDQVVDVDALPAGAVARLIAETVSP